MKEFLDEDGVKGYEENLSIVHKVQKDLKLLTSAFSNEKQHGGSGKQFHRGSPRIIIFVDDLDRCETEAVVKTLEVLKLIVQTEVFVVVAAIDMDYVTRALEVKYKGILKRGSHPSGLDYLEKIIQLPYRIPPMEDKKYISNYVESLTKSTNITSDDGNDDKGLVGGDSVDTNQSATREGGDSVDTNQSATREDNNNSNNASDVLQEDDKKQEKKGADHNNNKVEEGNKNTDSGDEQQDNNKKKLLSNKQSVEISEPEKVMLKDVFDQIKLSQRSLKRVVNAFKVMKFIWYCNKESGHVLDESDEKMQKLMKASLTILALLACRDPAVCFAMSKIHAQIGQNQSYDDEE